MTAALQEDRSQVPIPGDGGTSDHRMSSTTEVDVEKNAHSSPDDGHKEGLLDDSRPGAKAGLSVKQFWIVMLGLNVGMFLTALDFNIVATAVPIISSEFNSYLDSSWLGTGYLVSFALCLPVYGKCAEIFGRRNLFIFANLVFILGSGLCGGSSSMNMLIASRIVQGIGGGGIYGLVTVIITADLVALRDAGKYLSFIALVWGIADVVGPLLGGVFSQYVTWRWCFYINLCISPISLLITLFILKLPRSPVNYAEKARKYDYIGTIAMIGATTMILLGISWGGVNFPWKSGQVIGTLVGGVVLLIAFGIFEHFVTDPIFPPVFFRNRSIMAIFVAEFFYGASLLGMMYYVPQFFQLVFGDSATIAGVGLLPLMLGLAIGNPVAGWVTSKWGVSLANAWVGAALEVLIIGLVTRWNASTSRAEAVIELIILGIGMGAAMEGLLISAQAAVEPLLIGVVTGLVIFMQTVGDIFGIAIFAAVYQNKLRSKLMHLAIEASQIEIILEDVQQIRKLFSGDLRTEVIASYAESLQNGWWWMFACAGTLLIASAFAKQHKFSS